MTWNNSNSYGNWDSSSNQKCDSDSHQTQVSYSGGGGQGDWSGYSSKWGGNSSGGWQDDKQYSSQEYSNNKQYSSQDYSNNKKYSSQGYSENKPYSSHGYSSYNKGSNGGYGGGYGRSGSKGGYGNSGFNLPAVDFRAVRLVEFHKDFYVPCDSVCNRSEEECEYIRSSHNISIINGENVPKVIISFEEACFPEYLVRSLYRQFGPSAKPTPIQMQGWPVAMSGCDLVGIAQTGSGKTLAYVLPAIVHINAQEPAAVRAGPIALVLVPTRELCTQIAQETEKFSAAVSEVGGVPTKIACAFGGVKKNEQLWALRDSLDILVAAPGRLMDFLQSGETSLHRTTYLVLDEADQMFDMGFEPQLRLILSQIRPDRQTLMWSATWPREVRNLAATICRTQPVHIQVGIDDLAANHQIVQLPQLVSNDREKLDKLFNQVLPMLYLNENGEKLDGGKMLIFCNTKDNVDYLTKKMRDESVDAVAIHSGKEQNERTWVFDKFRHGDAKVLVSTNLMGRGVDVPKVNIVLNYDMPKNISEYIHRIGRTGRAGMVGKAISFFTYADNAMVNDLLAVMQEAHQDIPDWLREFQKNPYYRQPWKD